MTTTEFDLLLDEICDEAFDLLDELSMDNTMTDIELRNSLVDDYNISEMMASRVYGAWGLRNKEKSNIALAEGLKEPHPAHKARLKVLETVVKEILWEA